MIFRFDEYVKDCGDKLVPSECLFCDERHDCMNVVLFIMMIESGCLTKLEVERKMMEAHGDGCV